MPKTRIRPYKLLSIIVALATGVLAIDLTQPLGVAGGELYLPAMLLALWLPSFAWIFTIAVLCTLYTLFGHAFAPFAGMPLAYLDHRLISLAIIWAITLAGWFLKRGETALSESEMRYRRVVDMVSDGIFVIDRHSIMRYVSDRGADIFGFTPRELIGHPLARLMDAETFQRHKQGMTRYLETGKPQLPWRGVEVEGRHRDGSRVPHWLQIEKYTEHGQQYFIGTLHDLRDHHRLLASLNQQEWALGERTKELDCLYQLSLLASRPGISLAELCALTVELLPASWQHPAIARACIYFDDESYHTEEYAETPWCQTEELVVKGHVRGSVSVCYEENPPLAGKDSFLEEEHALLEEVATRLALAITRREAEIELEQLNAELEQRVEKRTAELQLLNHELDAFAYSVSHDLRAPLRSIDGFSQALMEDHADGLDPEGLHYLERVRGGTQRMGKLIDDLLVLSRTTRMTLEPQPVDLSRTALQLLAELQSTEPKRTMELQVAPKLELRGDASALVIVLQNLLGNAWKYTRHVPTPRIEVGMRTIDGQPSYFVADNGVGFDMLHAGRLFAAFERLHPAEEFPGTGIGLAIVQRLIQRHGGRVWAEAEVDKGACFYFTVGEYPTTKTPGS